MSPYEISRLGQKSALVYYNYLTENRKGLQRIPVTDIHKSEKYYYLRLLKAPFNLESIFFIIDGMEYKSDALQIVDYDEKRKLLAVRPSPEHSGLFLNVSSENVFVVSDLRFLVKRVEDFYKKYGEQLKFERPVSSLKYKPMEDMPYHASDEQTKALETIFSSPFSYIWGAPGTGKTRFVLANAVLQYIRSNKKVVILAPTNNALEQTLFGILDILEATNVPFHKVLRLGIPSKGFSEKYPECCEIKDVDKRIDAIDEELKSLFERQKALHAAIKFNNQYQVFMDKILPCMEQLNDLYCQYAQEINQSVLQMNRINLRADAIKGQISANQSIILEYEKQKDALTSDITIREKSLNTWYMFFLRKKARHIKQLNKEAEECIKDLQNKIVALYQENKNYHSELLQSSHAVQEIKIPPELLAMISVAKQFAKDTFSADSKIICNMSTTDISDAYALIIQHAKQYEIQKEKHKALLSKESDALIQKQIDKLKNQRNNLVELNESEKIKNAQVVAVTVDGFINRYSSNDENDKESYTFEADHYFLDEAGYCSLIKGATLLIGNCPITFLGDHMQLPPVCELDTQTIIRNKEYEIVSIWSQSALAIETMFFERYHVLIEQFSLNFPFIFANINKSDLTETYRFGKELSSILDEKIYHNGLHSSKSTDNFKIKVISVQKTLGEKRRENPAEAFAIINWINENTMEEYAVLSPYINQVKLISSMMKNDKDKAMTIHTSQGREWDTVILSVSDTTDKYFTDSNNTNTRGIHLLNTAISRAKKQLIIVCDTSYWKTQSSQFITLLIQIAETKNRSE